MWWSEYLKPILLKTSRMKIFFKSFLKRLKEPWNKYKIILNVNELKNKILSSLGKQKHRKKRDITWIKSKRRSKPRKVNLALKAGFWWPCGTKDTEVKVWVQRQVQTDTPITPSKGFQRTTLFRGIQVPHLGG